MKKIIVNLILFLSVLIITLITILSTIGIKTNKFNKLIQDTVSQTKNISLDLNKIIFKLDPKEISLFLETDNPIINYREILIPVQNIKVYVDFVSLFKSDPRIKKINLNLEELNITQLNKLSTIIKPSNFKNLINNKITKGTLKCEIEIYLDTQGSLKNFIAKGNVKNLNSQLIGGLSLTNGNFSFFADKEDILVKNIFGSVDTIKLTDGDIKLNLENGLSLKSNFNSKIILNKNFINKYSKLLSKLNLQGKLKNLSADFENNLSINFDKTYKVKDYSYGISGSVNNSNFELLKPLTNPFIKKEFKEIYLSNFKIKSFFSPESVNISGNGQYSFDNKDFLNLNLETSIKDSLLNLKLDFDYKDKFELDLINYKKPINSISNLSLDLDKKKKNLYINKLNFKEGNNSIKINGLQLKNNNFVSFDKIVVETINNNFSIKNGKTIQIKGSKFDATNLSKFFSHQSEKNNLKNLNSNIEIDFKNIRVPMSEKLQNFKLLGEIKKGKFVKISSKGDFGGNNFLDISMKKSENSNKKYLEIYSDLPRPLLTEYDFFKGLSGGKLLFTSIIEGSRSNSKLKIENFKLINAPAVVKLLSLADLGGLADLAEGEGLSFNVLEIDMEKNQKFLNLREILALGPSMSVLMEGYQDNNGLTSLRGTLVPAKTLNKIISKIPVLGDIIIPKEAGEGLFGISFKMKGPEGKIKTTINPIRTLTPRFIQKIIDKNNKAK